ncbi:ABC transporter ATP-binding protein [Catenulispora yoronensis]|uniref:ABC transporter ATP-binding protein n=1 Tax=Catenulispora yoronensis TaxID=450799 RepID=A0ABN2V6C4_9ACTN
MYRLTAVTKDYQTNGKRVSALTDVSLTIDDGEWLAVKGPTGQGKSTLLQLLGGLSRPTSGSILVSGEDLSRMPDTRITRLRAETIGFVFQFFNLLPTLTAQENVEAALVPLGIRSSERRRRAAEALDSVGLSDRATHLPSELSGGQQQRVAIARALVKEPRVLLADEPTGNLDEDTAAEIIDLLEQRWRSRGLTVVLVTHDNAIARRAQRVAVMRRGRLTIAPSQTSALPDVFERAGFGEAGLKAPETPPAPR